MNISKENIKDYLGGFGCLTIILIVLAVVFLLFPAIIFLASCLWGGAVYLLWNFVLVPVCGIAAINFWWQSWIFGLVTSMVLGALKGVAKSGKSD